MRKVLFIIPISKMGTLRIQAIKYPPNIMRILADKI